MKCLNNLFFATLILAGFISLFGKSTESLENTRPNITFILTDDQGMGDLSCMGNSILHTSHIDNLYRASTRFTDFQVSPTCSPTRAAIMSGRLPFEVGISHTLMQRDRLAPDVGFGAVRLLGWNDGVQIRWNPQGMSFLFGIY